MADDPSRREVVGDDPRLDVRRDEGEGTAWARGGECSWALKGEQERDGSRPHEKRAAVHALDTRESGREVPFRRGALVRPRA